MPRIARTVIEGLPHHITQRGNRQGQVFFSDEDRRAYLRWLGEYARKHEVVLLAYCLMDNHVHLVAVPENPDGLERMLRPLHTRYAQRINRSRGWKGHLWQGRFFSSALDESYLRCAIRYVERNPVRAGMLARAENYPWSSAAHRCGLRVDPIVQAESPWLAALGHIADMSAWLAIDDDSKEIDTLRGNADRGLPCGTETFVRSLESKFSRTLAKRPRGRPSKGRESGIVPRQTHRDGDG